MISSRALPVLRPGQSRICVGSCARFGEFAFEEVATSVEERFRRAYDADKVGTAKVESQMEFTLVSLGWWLVIKRLGLALWIGKDKPAIESGDLLSITIRKRDLPVQ
jgi:hypothetical protein